MDAVPIDPAKRALPAEAFSAAVAEFLEDRFAGAVKVRVGAISHGFILVASEYVAAFFKRLLTDVYGRVLLNIEIDSDADKLYIRIGTEGGLPLTEKEERDLIRAARCCGFGIGLTEEGFSLYAELSPATIRRVYAISIADGRRIMLGKFVEIFYQGEPLSADEPTVKPHEGIKRRTTKK